MPDLDDLAERTRSRWEFVVFLDELGADLSRELALRRKNSRGAEATGSIRTWRDSWTR